MRAARENTGCCLLALVRLLANARHGLGAVFRRGLGRGRKEPRHLLIFLLSHQRQQVRILGLVAREGQRGRHDAAQRFLVRFVGRGASCAAIHRRADGNAERVLRDVLMDGVVREASQCIGSSADVHFGFVRFAQLEYFLGDALEFRRR